MTKTATLPPQSLEAEESVIGAMLLNDSVIPQIVECGLTGADFYRQSHGILFQTACDMADQGLPVDAITIHEELVRRGQIDAAGGKMRLHELAGLVPASSNAVHYALIVRETAGLRRLIGAGTTIAGLGYGAGKFDDLQEQAEEALRQAVDASAATRGALPIAADLAEIGLDVKKARESGQPNRGLETGFPCLDTGTLRGFWPGQLIVCAARPGMGKSALALNIAENFTDRGDAVLFATFEMSRRELQIRSLARASKVDSRDIEEGLLDDDQLERLRYGYSKVQPRLLYIQDDGGTSPSALRAEARRFKRTNDIKLLVVDYIQLLAPGTSDNKNQEIAAITRNLKLLARDLGIPVLALSQLNRGLENRQEKRPTLSDLRDSGAIEQDADVVLFLYNHAAYDPDAKPEEAGDFEVIIAKNRKGCSGTEKLTYTGKYLTFNSIGGTP